VKLYVTPGSPYARMARIVVLEKGLQPRVEIIQAQTRKENSPYYAINPSGRVPYLVRDDGVGMEESALICDYLDRLDARPRFALPTGEKGWEARRLEARNRDFQWRPGHPKLCDWYGAIAARPSFAATVPPG
jgi:glutathione S-transferase